MFQPSPKVDQKAAHIVFLCDVSGSMSGDRINNMNMAIRSVLGKLASRSTSLANPKAIDVSTIRFSDAAEWHLLPSKLHDKFVWYDLQKPTGITNLGQAYALLDSWLNSNTEDTLGNLIIVLITDGMPTDEPQLSENWLINDKVANNVERIAFALGSDAESTYLDEFVSKEDNLYILRNESMLNELLTRALTKAIQKVPSDKHH